MEILFVNVQQFYRDCLFNSFFSSTIFMFSFQHLVKSSLQFFRIAWDENPAKLTVIYQLSLLLSFDHLVEKPIILSYRSYHLLTLKWLLQRRGLSLSHAKTPKCLPTDAGWLFCQLFLFWAICLKALLSRESVKWRTIAKSRGLWQFLISLSS